MSASALKQGERQRGDFRAAGVMRPTRTTVDRPQEMLLCASTRCRSTMTSSVSVHSSAGCSIHQIFESQLIIRDSVF
ncbi:hypothetical protein BDA96_04G342800 [Sorghum bicolor]|nr:hypothetical protein BDA96_04G342800 [Sorghum bicolor]